MIKDGVLEGDWIMWDYSQHMLGDGVQSEEAGPWECGLEGFISLPSSSFSLSASCLLLLEQFSCAMPI